MITQLQIQGFKSWRDTGPIRMAPLTGFFGLNSSGKTAILQLLLVLKQTSESADRSRVLHTGDERSYVDVGTFYDVIYGHHVPGVIRFSLRWNPPEPLRVIDPEKEKDQTLFSTRELGFEAAIEGIADSISVTRFDYNFSARGTAYRFGMQRQEPSAATTEAKPVIREEPAERAQFNLLAEGHDLKRFRGRGWPLPSPVKCYGFPDQVKAYYQNAGFLSQFVLAFEELFQGIYYLGPLREYPHRSYVWAGEQPQDVGRRGELAVPALLASRKLGKAIGRGKGRHRQTVEERVAEWLKELGLIHSFSLRQIASNRKDYEVRIRQSASAPEVLVTDVGFGVSQILPVLVLCYYVPKGSTIILEQPEIHLHPAVQTGLADVFIDAIRTRNLQIIVESHSEHLLRRLQRRVAEGELGADQTALYFARMEDSASSLDQLQMDLFGNITNWPEGFFGDELGELAAMTEAAMRRQSEGLDKAREDHR